MTPGSPTEATSSSSSSSTSASFSDHGSCRLGTYVVRPPRRTCAPQRAVRKSSSGVGLAGLPTRTTIRLLGRRPGRRSGPGRSPGRPPAGTPSAPSGTAARWRSGSRAPPPPGRCPGSGTPPRGARSRRPSRAARWSRGRCRSRAPGPRPTSRRPSGTAPARRRCALEDIGPGPRRQQGGDPVRVDRPVQEGQVAPGLGRDDPAAQRRGLAGDRLSGRLGTMLGPRVLSARRTLRASARPPRSGDSATTPAAISQGLARTSAFSP